MAQDYELGKWIREKFRSQAKFAEKIGAHPTLISRWMGGAGISEDYEKAIRKLGYTGLLPSEEAQDRAAGGPAPYVTREDAARDYGRLEGRIEALERAFERLAEGFRRHLEKEPGEAHPQDSA
jgi:hypothetical protein